MNWILDQKTFQDRYLKARTCVYIDSARLPTNLQKLTFDDAEICTVAFAGLLQHLLIWSGDETCTYLVLDPDPVYYFHRLFGRYPALEIRSGISAESYLKDLNEGPPESPGDAAGTVWSECVIVPSSESWFMHALRSDLDDGGHLWIPPLWVDKVEAVYPYLTAA